LSSTYIDVEKQDAYRPGKPGKPGKFREFVHSGKVRENSGNSWMSQGIFNTWKI